MTAYGKSFKKVYISTLIDVVVLKCRKTYPTGNRRNRALLTSQKEFGSLSNCRYCVDRAQNLPGPAANIWLTLFQISSIQIGSLSAEL